MPLKLRKSQFYMIILYKLGKVLKIFESSKCNYHIICKDTLTFEAYLNVLPFSLANIRCRFRCSLNNHFFGELTEISGYVPFVIQTN